jgi:hypothetical protein
MQVAHHYFENGIAHFTRRINKCISMGTANGEVAPFVGHNAFLRWSAIQEVAFVDPADSVKKIWSEANVSEVREHYCDLCLFYTLTCRLCC